MESVKEYHCRDLADKLERTGDLTDEEFISLLESEDPELNEYLAEKARPVRERYYAKEQ